MASVSGGLAVEPGLLIASRVVQGIGAAMLAPAGLSVLSPPGRGNRNAAAVLVAVHGAASYRTAVAMFIAAGFALVGPLATLVMPPALPHAAELQPQPEPRAAPSVPP